MITLGEYPVAFCKEHGTRDDGTRQSTRFPTLTNGD